jgi:hypothetical protein
MGASGASMLRRMITLATAAREPHILDMAERALDRVEAEAQEQLSRLIGH